MSVVAALEDVNSFLSVAPPNPFLQGKKRLLAESMLDNAALKDVLSKNW
jgi:hypothetical protein